MNYELESHKTKALTGIALVSILAAVAFASAFIFVYLQPKGRLSCADFGSYSDALNAYNHGSKYLDGNGDGIPCNALYIHDKS